MTPVPRRRGPGSRRLGVAFAVALVAGCTGGEPSSGRSGSGEATAGQQGVSAPSLEGVEPAAREQLEAQRRLIERLASSPRARGAELAEAYGELGRL
ncbi:MAG TPA: hypothetical protein VLF66_12985, partial [Thermoanaerobaculia bacterium]|nr:hypothetical protein [Thermoanaerobaculia bacterium]